MIDRVDDETLLDRFRHWLQEARAQAEALEQAPGDQSLEGGAEADDEVQVREVGIFQVIEEFTALRHEIKLQTRSSRGLQEQSESLLGAMQQAIDQFRSVEAKEDQAAWTTGKPMAEALADLDEALDRGRTELEKASRRLTEAPVQAMHSAFDAVYAQNSWFKRRLLKSYHEQVKEIARDKGQARRELVEALLEGYNLIQARLRRALKAERIHAIECLNRPVDPELMTVVEVVEEADRPPGVVVEQIRRGYTWQGRLLRYAEVRASRAPTATP